MGYSKRTGIMLAYPFELKRLEKWNNWPVIVQPKFNGERCRIIHNERFTLLLSSTEELITSVPHIRDAVQTFLPYGEYDTELYVHGWTFEEIHSVVSRTANLHERHAEIEAHFFDIMTGLPQFERTLHLSKLFNQETIPACFKQAEFHLAYCAQEVLNLLELFYSRGYEGIIIRHGEAPYMRKRSTYVMKFKPKQCDAYRIVGVQEEHTVDGVPKNVLGCVQCVSDDGEPFNVYSGFTDQQRAELWAVRETLPGLYLKVRYQSLTAKRKVPSFGTVNSREAMFFESSIIDGSEARVIETGKLV